MKSRKFFLPIILIIIAMVIVACGGDEDSDSDSGDNTGGDTNLSQSISFDDTTLGMTISVDYPDGWASQAEDGSLILGNNQESLDMIGGDEAPTGDQIGGNVIYFDDETLAIIVDGDAPSLSDILTSFAAPSGDDSDFELGDIEETTVGDVNIVYAEGTGGITDDNVTVSFAYAITEVEGGIVMGIFATEEGEIGQYADEIKGIVASASVAATE